MRKQSIQQPLFGSLLWSRPENRNTAGKLLIIGGNLHGFSAPALAYNEASKAGIGSARVVLPSALKQTVGKVLEYGEYAPSTPSGSFSKQALAELLESSGWADGVLIAGDLGRNSETAILLESYLRAAHQPVTITKDGVDYFVDNPSPLLNRQQTTIVCTMAQLQRIAMTMKTDTAVTFSMDLVKLADTLELLSKSYAANFIVKHLDDIFVAVNGEVSVTKIGKPESAWRVAASAHAAVWWLQNPSKPFEAMTTAMLPLDESA